jgi:hypothetical protein
VVAAASFLIKPPRLHPYLNGDIKTVVGVMWFSGASSGWGIFRSPWSFVDVYSLFFVSDADVVFLTYSATFCP